MKKLFPAILIVILFLFLLPLIPAHALEVIPDCAKEGAGDICCALKMAHNVARWILGAVGAFALLFFVYGGYVWISSAGAAERVKRGKSVMANTVIGIVVVILAWTIVNFIITSLAGKPQIVGNSTAWYDVCIGQQTEGDTQCIKSMGEDWSCYNLSTCGVVTWEECATKAWCKQGLCPSSGKGIVCCNPNLIPNANQ